MVSAYTSFSDVFRIGVGPSSSHTVGPMRAARDFVCKLDQDGMLDRVTQVSCTLQGSLAATGLGHQTPNAVVAGLQGYKPSTYTRREAEVVWEDVAPGINSAPERSAQLHLNGTHEVTFSGRDISFAPNLVHELHTNSLVLNAFEGSDLIRSVTYLSPGGGAIEVVAQDGTGNTPKAVVIEDQSSAVPTLNLEDEDISDYSSANELVRICEKYDKSIAEVARRQEEIHWGDAFDESKFNARIDKTWETMNACIDAGIDKANMEQPMMPGGLGVRKRAPEMFERVQKLKERGKGARIELLACYALAVNEQNAIGERIVTSPTAGSAGVIPAVIRWWKETEDVRGWSRDAKTKIEIRRFLLTAGVIGSIIKANGSISGAECGCQAEIGSACAMAAAGLAAVKGGSPAQVENAAEIALEYHFGLTCDPVGGLVLIPCIERNAMAANTAVTAASLALAGNGSHQVSLDTAIKTMRQTGIDMDEAYKETSRAGLATYVGC